MLSFIVRMKFALEDREGVTRMLTELTHESRLEPGCVSYITHFVEGDPTSVLIYEQYVDEAALEAHRKTAHFSEHAIGGLYQCMRERSIENLIAIA